MLEGDVARAGDARERAGHYQAPIQTMPHVAGIATEVFGTDVEGHTETCNCFALSVGHYLVRPKCAKLGPKLCGL